MREFEIYLPTKTNEGTAVDPATIESIKATLVAAFGGYTHLNHHHEGAWKMGGVTFYDAVTIIRVLDDGSADFDMEGLKSKIARSLNQQSVLIVSRAVEIV